ncbi:MAG: hypothetical protein JRJ45_01935 [Deltaproteobacteria bacterium]|nr:hypothetical protein [Deltaproteobacteria bacterium]
MPDNLFTAISSKKMTSLIEEAFERVIIVTPAVFEVTGRVLLATNDRLSPDPVDVVPNALGMERQVNIHFIMGDKYGR